ncbi:13855_t:CDS:2, partial [Acaulospora colombiana]
MENDDAIKSDPNSQLKNREPFAVGDDYDILENGESLAVSDDYDILENGDIIEWVPYSQLKNRELLAVGGFGRVEKACWSSEPSDRPTMTEIVDQFSKWFFDMDDINDFYNSEELRKRLMEEPQQSSYIVKHSEAFYTSRSLE